MPTILVFLSAAAAALGFAVSAGAAPGVELRAAPAQASTLGKASGFDGVVEAVRQTVVAAQVPGAVVRLGVKAGDHVVAGQVLLRIDSRAADQNAAASDAQVQAARASLDVATRDLERQKQLFQQNYISRAALDRAEAAFKSTRAQVESQLAQAGAARTESGLHIVRAPFAGVIAEVPVSLGDMAVPGRPLLTLYDPSALRVTAAVPQTMAGVAGSNAPRIELPGLLPARQWVVPTQVQRLPTVDAGTHTFLLRADLPASLSGATPGMFARVWLLVPAPEAATGAMALNVSGAAVVRRAEMTGLYVLDPEGKPVLRQVRLGRVEGDQVEVLSGLMPGELVVTDPQAAARAR